MQLIRTICVLSTIFLTACASNALPTAMTVSMDDVQSFISDDLKDSFFVRTVTGGKETNPMWTSQVNDEGFKSALEKSLFLVGYQAASESEAKYLIDAELTELAQPIFGLSVSVTSNVQYVVSEGSKEHVFPVEETGTAEFSERFLAFERLRLANEYSIKANITEFLRQISEKLGGKASP